jgi:membrane-bound lytic murein transglycosylase F
MVTQPPARPPRNALLHLLFGAPERIFIFLLAAAVLFVLWSYQRNHDRDGTTILSQSPILPPVTSLDDLKEVVVATRLGVTTYLTEPDGRTVGLDHDLALSFGSTLGKPVRFLVLDNLNQALDAVRTHRAHFAAAAVHVAPELQKDFAFTAPYLKSRPQVVFNRELTQRPASPAELAAKRLGVVPDPVYLAILEKLRAQNPTLSWQSFPRGDVDLELLQKVYDGDMTFALADSNTVAIAQNYYPDLSVAFDLGPEEPIAWAFLKEGSDHLAGNLPAKWSDPIFAAARDFLARLERNGSLGRAVERYFGHVSALGHEDSATFLQKMVSRLPHFAPTFKRAQELTAVDWRLLAAIAYQESHWDNDATSPTGVRGIMMLTADTADRLHVSNRLNPDESISAAARYLQQLKEMVPARIAEPDRTWMALAAYNVGYAHLEDARILAQRNKLNADSWNDLKKMLPLLSLPSVYETTKYGFARGGEPVNFVENVRSYYDILSRFEKPYRPAASLRGGLPNLVGP